MAFESLSDKLNAAFKKLRGKGRLTQGDIKEAMKEVRMALLEADVSYKVVKDFTARVTERASGADVLESLSPAQMVIKIVNEELCALMGSENQKLNISSKSPSVVMLVGLQGAGKTTNGAKLAAYMRKQGKRPLLAACDIYRPAAIEQLETVGKQLDIPVFQMGQTNPVDIAKAAVEHAKKYGNDLVFLDTAGRLHIDEELMQELQNIKEAVGPAEILLVVDAMWMTRRFSFAWCARPSASGERRWQTLCRQALGRPSRICFPQSQNADFVRIFGEKRWILTNLHKFPTLSRLFLPDDLYGKSIVKNAVI